MLQVLEPEPLGVTISAPDGDIRASWDSADAFDCPTAGIVRTDLHGFGPAEISLPRPEGAEGRYAQDRASRWKLAPVRVWDAAGRNVWEGRVIKVSVGATSIDLDCEGPAKSLEDDETARMIGVDRDLSAWGGPSVQRRINVASSFSLEDPSVDPDPSTGAPAVSTKMTGAWGTQRRSEAWYDAQGLDIGSIYYAWKKNANITASNANWGWEVRLSSDDLLSASDVTGDLRSAGPGTGTLAATTSRKFALLYVLHAIASGTAGTEYIIYWTGAAVYGNHGLDKRGTESATTAKGFYASDLAEYVVGRWGPLVSVNTRSIEPTSFVIPHWVHKEDTTAAAMLDSLALFGGNNFLPLDWWVYDDWTFGMASPDNHGRVWRIRLDEAAELADAGDDATTRVNGVKVTYCVDPETECLTKRGWLSYDELSTDDELLAFNPEDQTTRWEQPREVFIERDYEGPMVRLENNRLDVLTTPDHRWPIANRPRRKDPRRIRVVTSETLPLEGYMLRHAPHARLPTEPTHSDAMVRLIAWYFTEGSRCNRRYSQIGISQSRKANLPNVEAIRADLHAVGTPTPGYRGQISGHQRREGISFAEYCYDGDKTLFKLSGCGIDEITEAAPGKKKVPTLEFLTSLTLDQLEIFIDTCILGDGTARRIFYQHDDDRMGAYMAAAILAGYSPSLHDDGKACCLNETHSRGTELRRLRRSREHYRGVVWCPVTESGHWVARRKGKVFITGNTDGAGTQHTVGPPGSGSETETTDLEDTRPDNPVNLAKGASRKIRSVDMGITYEDGAILMGQTVMADANRQKWSGDIQVKGSVREQGAGGAEEPAYMVRTFDRGVVEDDPDISERRVTGTAYDIRTRTNTLTVGTPPELFPALAARAGVVIEGRV